MPAAASGPNMNPPITMTASFRSKDRNPCTCGKTLESKVAANATALSMPSVATVLTARWVFVIQSPFGGRKRSENTSPERRSSFIRTIPSVSESHRILRTASARRLYCRWGIAPRPEELFFRSIAPGKNLVKPCEVPSDSGFSGVVRRILQGPAHSPGR